VRSLTLDEMYLMIAHVYGEQNAQRSASSTFAHFVEVCGMLTIHDRKKKRESVSVDSALCKALGWFFPLMAKYRVSSVEELVYRKYPYACPYCRRCPHEDAVCKTVRGTQGTVDHAALKQKYQDNLHRRPKSLNEWQRMFAEIYPRSVNEQFRSTVGLFEELGELAEGCRVFERHPKYFAGEAADVFSYLMGIANEHALRVDQADDRKFSFEDEMIKSYPGLCVQCGYEVCVCPSIPEATVGRLSKELELVDKSLFELDYAAATPRGREACSMALQRVGGYTGLLKRFPFDRGDANRALMLLYMNVADALPNQHADAATKLRAAALRVASTAAEPGSRDRATLPDGEIALLRETLSTAGHALDRSSGGSAGALSQPISKIIAQKRVLIVAASPKDQDRLRVSTEERTIRASLKSSMDRDSIAVDTLNAATPDDLRGALLKQSYDIVHFAGHASAFSVVFEDEYGATVASPLKAVSTLLGRYPRISCVVVNGCSSVQALTSPIVGVTVGMTKTIDDDAAIEFARGFYDAICADKGYEFAAEEGVSAANLKGFDVPLKVLK
jgi:NTP pyrophosphatase (non-canonical NTP hydrolase)